MMQEQGADVHTAITGVRTCRRRVHQCQLGAGFQAHIHMGGTFFWVTISHTSHNTFTQ